MEARLLQDFVTVKGTPNTNIIQPIYGWLDLGPYEDVILYCDVREAPASSPPTMSYETAPSANDASFVSMLTSFNLTVGVQTNVFTASLANIPPARYLRWHITPGPSNWDVTFRIWAALYRYA